MGKQSPPRNTESCLSGTAFLLDIVHYNNIVSGEWCNSHVTTVKACIWSQREDKNLLSLSSAKRKHEHGREKNERGGKFCKQRGSCKLERCIWVMQGWGHTCEWQVFVQGFASFLELTEEVEQVNFWLIVAFSNDKIGGGTTKFKRLHVFIFCFLLKWIMNVFPD